ncbi:MAG: tubulin-like doman-containing protein [Myxococcota bacterium]
MGLLAGEKFSPTLFIGLGGAGSRVVNLLAGKLKRHPQWNRLKDLTHFCVIDTNKDDLYKNAEIKPDARFLVSAFDRRSYVKRKQGLLELPEDPNLTQWVHPDYDFRSTQGAGAGQIRVESRLGLYYNLEDDRAGIRRKINAMLDLATRRENPWRDNEHRVVNICMYASVAGGTGSGGFLPMAYLIKDLVRDHGWGRPNLVSTLSLPSTFLDRVERQLHDDIRANGYAALKELEYLTKLGYHGHPDSLPFHYDPDANSDHRRVVDERPFSLTYIVDKPAEISLERYEHAVADAAFLQIFSPLLGAQAGEYDNYDKHQKSLALDHFAVHYGCYGTALLQLPRNDLLHYAAMRYTARALEGHLVFGADHPEFRVPWGEPRFERLDQAEKDRIADEKFLGWIAWQAGQEEAADEKGVFTAVHAQLDRHGRTWSDHFQERLQAIFDRLDELIDIAPVNQGDITTGNPSLTRQLEGLRRDTATSRAKVMGEFLQASITDLRTDRFFSKLFADLELNPLGQRTFLIHQILRAFLSPFHDPEEGAWLTEEGGNPSDLDSDGVVREVKECEERLQATAEQGLIGRMFSSENKEFNKAKRRSVQLFDRLAADQRDFLKRTFWRSFEGELRLNIEARLSAFRKVAEIASEQARDASESADRFRKDPATQPESDVARFYLDTEVMRNDRAADRLWDRLYAHLLDRSASFDDKRIFEIVTAAFSPARDDDTGRVRARDATEIVQAVRSALMVEGREVFTAALADLDLQRALELEARYTVLEESGKSILGQPRKELEALLASVSADDIRKRVLDKLQRVADECVTLAHLDKARIGVDDTVVPARIFYAGVAPRYDTDEPGSLGRMLREVASGVDFVEGWSEPDSIVLYRAMLGIPLYFFKRVTDELFTAYKKVDAKSNRTYPLHIDRNFEGGRVPNLDPIELKEARERTARESEAKKAAQERGSRLRGFTLCALLGTINRDESGYSWTMKGFGKPLAARRADAFEAFWQLDPTLRDDMLAGAESTMRARTAEKPDRARFRSELEAHRDALSGLYYQAVAEEREAEKRFLDDERRAVDELIAGLS